MTTSDRDLLDKFLRDALRGRASVRKILSQERRRRMLQTYRFSPDAVQALSAVHAEDLHQFAVAAYDQLRRLHGEEFLQEDEERTISALFQQGFSPDFIQMFDRMFNKQIGRKQDLFVVHFASEIAISDLNGIVGQLDIIYRDIAISYHGERFAAVLDTAEDILKVREFRHGSTEVFVSSAVEQAAILLQDPILQQLFVATLYDVSKSVLGRTHKFFVARRKQPQDARKSRSGRTKDRVEDAKNRLSSRARKSAQSFVETTVSDQKYLGIGNVKVFVWGSEKTTRITKVRRS